MYTRVQVFISASFLIYSQCRHFVKMHRLINIPPNVRGMKKLDKSLFTKSIDLPCLEVVAPAVLVCTRHLKEYLLKLPNFKNIQLVGTAASQNESESIDPINIKQLNEDKHDSELHKKRIFLDPTKANSYYDFKESERIELKNADIDEQNFIKVPVNLTYENWEVDEILKAVLPEDKEIASAYTLVGHVVHLNLKEHLIDYKYLIGQVLLDKIKTARTVVNKVNIIDNSYRCFKMEVLCGDDDLVAEVKENKCTYKLDFSKVYWNSRLCTEHYRIVEKLNSGDVLYDVFAGVGPFSIPAAKKKCVVLANDLNPESYKWLKHNIKLNKVENFIHTFNKDGIDFIKDDVKNHFLHGTELTSSISRTSHVVMNLPASSITFLDAFHNLFSVEEMKSISRRLIMHIYCFIKGANDSKQVAKHLIEEKIGQKIDSELDEITFVRHVATNKDMIRVSFALPEEFLMQESSKRKCADEHDQCNDNDFVKRLCHR